MPPRKTKSPAWSEDAVKQMLASLDFQIQNLSRIIPLGIVNHLKASCDKPFTTQAVKDKLAQLQRQLGSSSENDNIWTQGTKSLTKLDPRTSNEIQNIVTKLVCNSNGPVQGIPRTSPATLPSSPPDSYILPSKRGRDGVRLLFCHF